MPFTADFLIDHIQRNKFCPTFNVCIVASLFLNSKLSCKNELMTWKGGDGGDLKFC